MKKTYPCVLTIAGSDCSGGAGIQADIKTISALGAYAASAITAITVQNTLGVTGIHPVPPEFVRGQIEAVMTDIRPQAVKIGMINDVKIVERRDHVLITDLSPAAFIASTFLSKLSSANGPFLSERAIGSNLLVNLII